MPFPFPSSEKSDSNLILSLSRHQFLGASAPLWCLDSFQIWESYKGNGVRLTKHIIVLDCFLILNQLDHLNWHITKLPQGAKICVSCHWLKGQLISKCLFGVFDFFQKTNKIKLTWGIIVVKSNSFVCFWRKSMTPKNHFEINWPLVATNVA